MDQNPLGDDFSEDPKRPLDELCDIIVARHHAYLHRALPLIRAELARLTEPECAPARLLTDTREAFADVAHQLQGHLAKEEHVLFPALEALAKADREGGSRPALPFPTVLYPIRLMESEHARIEAAMERLRQVTHAFVAPEGASESCRHCLSELSRLDADLREHHRVESEVLFPLALELERRLP
ncbi:MAG: hemerythrin domain-containing protein [Acidobacteriota bacterium]|nr:hemerythrin domain-containing protein [Acidobacteriota bacterium]